MAGFTSYSELRDAADAFKALHFSFYKAVNSTANTADWASHWAQGSEPAAGSTPAGTPGTVYTNTSGSVHFFDSSPDRKFALKVSGTCAPTDMLFMVYDRLVAVGGISLTTTGNKTVSSSALPRYTDGEAVMAWVELSASETGSCTLSMNSYTNQDGTTGRAGASITFSANAQHTMIPLPLQAGDRGVQAISTLNVSAASTAGTINIVLLKPLMYLPLKTDVWNERDHLLGVSAYQRVFDGATLALATKHAGTGATTVWGELEFIYG